MFFRFTLVVSCAEPFSELIFFSLFFLFSLLTFTNEYV